MPLQESIVNADGIWLLKTVKFLADLCIAGALVLFCPWAAIFISIAYLVKNLCVSTRGRVLTIPPVIFLCHFLCFNLAELFIVPSFFAVKDLTNLLVDAVNKNLQLTS